MARLTSLLGLTLVGLLVWAAPAGPAFAKKKKKKGGKDPVEEQFTEAYESEDAADRAQAVTGLAKADDAVKLSILSKVVIPKEKRADVIARCVTVLETVKDEAVVTEMAALATRSGKTERRVVYIEALANMPEHAGAHKALLDLTKDQHPFVRGMAAYGLGRHRTADALEPLMALLADKSWVVQSSALNAIPKLADRAAVKAAVPRIVDFMDGVNGRLKDDCADTLRKITGKNLGRDPQDWRLYLSGKDPKKDEQPKGPKPAYGNENKPHFYGVEVTSHRVVLILDMSLSMYEPCMIDLDRLRRETSQRVLTGADAEKKAPKDANEFDIPWWRVKTGLDLARYQSIFLVSQLREEQHFEIITFSTEVHPWMGKLVPANAANKMKAIEMIRALEPQDKTNTWGAIAAAFDMMNNNAKNARLAPDEMWVITDGEPSVGDIVDKKQFVEAALQLYKVKQIRINCIGIGVTLPFMKKLCRKTGGISKFFE